MNKDYKKAKKFLDFEATRLVSKDASDEVIIEGYANTSTKDRVGDVVLPSAFEKSLPKYLENPVLLEQHDWDKVAGKTLEAGIVEKGLYIKARISDTRPDLKTLVKEGCLSTFSIGYNELDADYDEYTKTKIVKELELLEISVVSIPANTEAKFRMVDNAPVAPVETAKQDETAPAKCDKCEGDCMCGEKSEGLKSFIATMTEACGGELDKDNLEVLSQIFKEEDSNIMKLNKKQLIEALKASIKSVEEVKAEAPAPAAAAPAADAKPEAPKPEDAMKEVMAKLDKIAQACAMMLESLKSEDKPAESAEPMSEEMPAEAAAPAPEAAKSDAEKSLETMTPDELAQYELEINEQLESLEDNE